VPPELAAVSDWPSKLARWCTVRTLAALVAVGLSVVCWGERLPAASLPVIRSVRQLRALSLDDAKRGYPVHLRGIVTYSDAPHNDLFVQDATGAVFVDRTGRDGPDLHLGQLLDVEGITKPADFATDIADVKLRVLSEGRLPPARKVSAEKLASGTLDCLRVEVEGVVRFGRELPGWVDARYRGWSRPVQSVHSTPDFLIEGPGGRAGHNSRDLRRILQPPGAIHRSGGVGPEHRGYRCSRATATGLFHPAGGLGSRHPARGAQSRVPAPGAGAGRGHAAASGALAVHPGGRCRPAGEDPPEHTAPGRRSGGCGRISGTGRIWADPARRRVSADWRWRRARAGESDGRAGDGGHL
jgi:hypothetical protein